MLIYSLAGDDLREVDNEISSILASKKPEVFGMLLPYIKRGGKRLRPALLLLICRALKGDMGKAVKLATIIELFHNFTLMHDDICDNSAYRRGEPTLHVQYGVPIALNSGDALYTTVWNTFPGIGTSPKKTFDIQKLCGAVFEKVTIGQGMELSWYRENRFDLSEDNYFEMAGGKTASLIGLSCQLGGLLASAPKRTREKLRMFGEKLGLAFQIHDDVLNIDGDFKKYKKKIGEDISEGKRTIMVIHLLARATPQEREKVIHVLSTHSTVQQDIDYVIAVMKRYGSLDYARKKAAKLVSDAKNLLSTLEDSEQKKALMELADYVVSREE